MAERKRGTIVLGAGGTGGHMFPAQALAGELTKRGYDIVLITDERGKAYTDRFPTSRMEIVRAATFAGRNPFMRIAAMFQIVGGIFEAVKILGELTPKVAVGFGGYPSLPTMTAAKMLGVPTALHDPNAVLGRVNKFLAPHVDLVGAAFENMEGLPKGAAKRVHVVGNPLRAEVIAARNIPYTPPSGNGPIKLLVFGGSQGAAVFADIVTRAVELLPETLKARLHVTLQARAETVTEVERDFDEMGVRADVAPFFADLPQRMAEAQLVIGRAGASTVTELGVIGRPAILVPLPTAMDDHQTVNARALTEPGGAWLMPQAGLTSEILADKLRSLLCEEDILTRAAAAARATGRPRATAEFADLIEGLIK